MRNGLTLDGKPVLFDDGNPGYSDVDDDDPLAADDMFARFYTNYSSNRSVQISNYNSYES